jgi:hypothetical protein
MAESPVIHRSKNNFSQLTVGQANISNVTIRRSRILKYIHELAASASENIAVVTG